MISLKEEMKRSAGVSSLTEGVKYFKTSKNIEKNLKKMKKYLEDNPELKDIPTVTQYIKYLIELKNKFVNIENRFAKETDKTKKAIIKSEHKNMFRTYNNLLAQLDGMTKIPDSKRHLLTPFLNIAYYVAILSWRMLSPATFLMPVYFFRPGNIQLIHKTIKAVDPDSFKRLKKLDIKIKNEMYNNYQFKKL